MNGSAAMLEKAEQNFSGANVRYRHQSFEDYIASPANDELYDFVYSANAIHHLDFLGKSQIYAKIFRELKFDDLFLNFDPVLPASERSEQWQFNMWTDWIKEYLQKNGIEEDAAKIDAIPTNYKMKSENKPGNLFDQLQLLTKVGYRDVDCFYKYGIFALFGGTKQKL
jgi:tRNA (cmo5U34)-methyltransferase